MVIQTDTQTKRDLTLTRTFNVPLTDLWNAWVDPSYVKRWWGPEGFTCPVAEMDVRDGGTSLVAMRTPDGHDLYSTWAYRQIIPGQRMEYVFNLSDATGRKVDPTELGMPPDFPREVLHVVELRALGDRRSELTITEHGYTSPAHFEMSKAGLAECLDKMERIFR